MNRHLTIEEERDIVRAYRREILRGAFCELVLWVVLIMIVLGFGAAVWQTHLENERQIRIHYR
jgi:hypothetical protein